MQPLQTIKHRLRSVKNIGQITKAMELVAATKMRRSQEVALASRPYAYAALEFLANLSCLSGNTFIQPLLEKRPVEKTVIVLMVSDKGLTGSFNSAVFRAFESELQKISGSLTSGGQHLRKSDSRRFQFIAVGKKAVSFLLRQGKEVRASFTKFGDITTVEETRPLAIMLMEGYLAKEWDRALVFYTNFRSALRQDVVVRELFPVTFEKLKETAQEIIPQTGKYAEEGYGALFREHVHAKEKEYIIEPSPYRVLMELIPHLIVMQVYHIVLEANASEHAARRMAMKYASDNAADIGDALTLEYNKSRQAGITGALIEITGGVEAINN